jgi:D-alanine transaminase
LSRIAYVNGRYLPLHRPAVGIEDRGFQFADGVYEVIKILDGRPRDLERHLDRLERSLGALEIEPPTSRGALQAVIREVLKRNGLRQALLYIQVTRGVAARNHVFPRNALASLVVTARRPAFPSAAEQRAGIGVITQPDLRWGRCDIKSISLLANVLARQRASEHGCREAWLVTEDGRVTEGSASNVYLVDRAGRLITHPLGERILGGITRSVLLELARGDGIEVEERPFDQREIATAREAALTSTTSLVLPVVKVDGQPVGDGAPGPVVGRLMELYRDHLRLPERPNRPHQV